jgi:hypothetical protein
MNSLLGLALALSTFVGSAQAQDRSDPRDRYLRALPTALEDGTLRDAQSLIASVPPEVGQTLLLPDGNVRLTLARPVSARWLARVFGWERPVAVSGDVHMRTFSIMRGDSRRVEDRDPIAGVWRVRAVLTAPPRGPIPRARWGAAPMYDLRRKDARVEHIFFTLEAPRR